MCTREPTMSLIPPAIHFIMPSVGSLAPRRSAARYVMLTPDASDNATFVTSCISMNRASRVRGERRLRPRRWLVPDAMRRSVTEIEYIACLDVLPCQSPQRRDDRRDAPAGRFHAAHTDAKEVLARVARFAREVCRLHA